MNRTEFKQLMKAGKKGRYRVSAKIDRTVDGVVFASKREADVYVRLKAMQTAKMISGLELQPVFKFPQGFEYRADFRFMDHVAGKVRVVDAKGHKTDVFRLKMKCLVYHYPEVELELW